MSGSPTPRTQLPPRLLPVLYFGAAHVALALAFGAVAIDPRGVSGFFYQARMLGIVHVITLGWITASILGPLYLVGPIALRVWIPATWLDYTAFALVLIGIVGIVAHFWIQDYASMAWSADTVGAGIMAVGVHVVRRLRAATLPRAVSAHIVLAFVNVFGAATMGVLIGFDNVYHFLPGVRAGECFRPGALGRDRLGLDDGRGHGVPAVADGPAGSDAQRAAPVEQRGAPSSRCFGAIRHLVAPESA